MRILVVEDDENKKSRILEYLRSRHLQSDVVCAGSLVAGLRAAKQTTPDLVILDMTLPNYDGNGSDLDGKMHAFGGKEYLRQTARMAADTRIIVLTQFESFGEAPHVTSLKDLDDELQTRFSENYMGAVYYHASIDDWMDQLDSIISSLGNKQ